MFYPRPYQLEATSRTVAGLLTYQSGIIIAATGTGKTSIFLMVANEWRSMRPNSRILILAHRRELVFQAYKASNAIFPDLGCEVEMESYYANHHPTLDGPPPAVVSASVQTLCQPHRLKRFDPNKFDLIIWDECHRTVKKNKQYNTILKHFEKSHHLGVTATSDRFDGEALGGVFAHVFYVYDIVNAVSDSWLVPIQQQFIQVKSLDLTGVGTSRQDGVKDLSPGELDTVCRHEGAVHEIVSPLIDIANTGDKPRRCLVFMPGVESARIACDIANRHGRGRAAWLSGESPPHERDQVLKAYREGYFQYLFGCDLFVEGFDEPRVQIVVPKNTLARSKFAQMIGRGTRTWPDCLDNRAILEDVGTRAKLMNDRDYRSGLIRASFKPSLLVVDPVGVTGQHKLINTFDILGGIYSPEARELASDHAKNTGKRVDVAREIRAAMDRKREEESKRRQNVVMQAQIESRPVDPFDLFDVTVAREPRWLKGKVASVKQIDYILKHSPPGTRLPEGMSLHAASTIIETIHNRRNAGPPTQRQAFALMSHGYNPESMTFAQASTLLDELLGPKKANTEGDQGEAA